MCGTPQRSRKTSTGSLSPATAISPSTWARTAWAFLARVSAVSWPGTGAVLQDSHSKTKAAATTKRRIAAPPAQDETVRVGQDNRINSGRHFFLQCAHADPEKLLPAFKETGGN